MIQFSSSYVSLSIDNLAFVVAVGIDVGDNQNLKVSFQFSDISSSNESGSSGKSNATTYSFESSSITGAINLVNSYVAKQINLSHCKIIVFSEELAANGIANEIYTLINNVQIRPSTNIVISKCDAKYYLENSIANLENLITKYYNFFPNSGNYTGYTYNATIGDFFQSITCKTCQPIGILGSTLDDDSNIDGDRDSKNIGLAVFKDYKLVGELDSTETICFSILKNKISSFIITIPNPKSKENNDFLTINLFPKSDSKYDSKIVNGTPYISITSSFVGRIYTMTPDSDYTSPDTLKEISQLANKYLETIMKNYLYKTSKEFKSDINGFGKSVLSKFSTSQDFENYNWLDNYKNSFFNVKMDCTIKSGFLLTQT